MLVGYVSYAGRMQWDPIFYVDIGVLVLAGLLWSCFRFVTVEPPETMSDLSRKIVSP